MIQLSSIRKEELFTALPPSVYVYYAHSTPPFDSERVCVFVYPFSREGGINLFGDHWGSIHSNIAEISQEG